MRFRTLLRHALIVGFLLHVSHAWAGIALQSFEMLSTGPGVTSGLFASIGVQGNPHAGVTSWPVVIDVAALGTLPPSLLVNFPDRAAVTLTRGRYQHRGPGAFLWTGRGGDCSAVFSAAPVALHGAISCLNANYGVEQAVGGNTLTLSRYRGDQSASVARPVDPPVLPLIQILDQTPATPNTDTVIDILVLYSEGTRQHFDPNGGKTGTAAFAQYCVDVTQQAMDDSTTNWQPGHPAISTVNLAAAKEVTGPSSPQTITDYLQYAVSDAQPIDLRNLYAADAVAYLVENGISAYVSGPR